MSKAVIVSGEASETDSEDEAPLKNEMSNITSICAIQGALIIGEDTESENENDASVSSAVSALGAHLSQQRPSDKPDSILHQKLRESNGKLHNNVDSYWHNIITEAGKNLNSIDQQLIKSQLTLQNAVTSLKSISANSYQIKNKLQNILAAQFIPNVNINNL